MASDETRKLLKVFGIAVTRLEEAIEAGAPVEEIGRLDAQLATCWRDVETFLENLRSRRLA